MFWKKKFKSFLVNEQYKVVEAFKLKGVTYFQFEDAFNMPYGRVESAMVIYEELRMKCSYDYLKKHVRACEKVLTPVPGRGMDLNLLVQLNQNLKERMELAPFPDHMFKLASVNYFDASESPYHYDFKYNEKKIKEWKASGEEMLDFFCQRLFPELMPSLQLSGISVATYLESMETLNQKYLKVLLDIKSSKV